jgi:hypothetical protein
LRDPACSIAAAAHRSSSSASLVRIPRDLANAPSELAGTRDVGRERQQRTGEPSNRPRLR